MATLDVPDFETTRQQLVAIGSNRVPELGMSPVEIGGELAGALAQAFQGIGESIGRAAADAVPSSDSSDAGLTEWATDYGISNRAGGYGARGATAAQGMTGQLTGQAAVLFPLGQAAQGPGGVRLKLRADVTLPGTPTATSQASGTLDVDSAQASSLGERGNLQPGAVCTWISPPANADSTFVITAGPTVRGREAETGPELLARIYAKTQRPPNGGNPADLKEWVEGAQDASGAAITSADIVAFIYPNYYGPQKPMAVMTLKGSGTARAPAASVVTAASDHVNGTSSRDGQRPAGSPVTVQAPYQPSDRALVVKCRCVVSKAQYAYDWARGATTYRVNAFTIAGLPAWANAVGANAVLELTSAAPATLKDSIDAGSQPRIFVHGVVGGAIMGPVVPEMAPCLAWQDAAGLTSLALKVSNAANWNSWIAANNEVFSGGPIVETVAASILTAVDALGPSRASGMADAASVWGDTLGLTTISTAAETSLDEDQITRLVARCHTGGVLIGVGGLATLTAADVTAIDNTINGPEVLVAGRILVTD